MLISMHYFCIPGKDMLNLFLGALGGHHVRAVSRDLEARGCKPALTSTFS
jgi:hypothetical protein